MAENMQLEGYTNLTQIGRGGMATIYRGYQTSLNRVVAIKLLSAEHTWDRQMQVLFEQESLIIAQLNHPNIIHIIDRGFTPSGRPFFVMEYVEGQTLAATSKKSSLSPQVKLILSMQICRGLAYAHKNGVIHRDIKPANLLIDKEGHLRILDFGIAWLNASGNPNSKDVVGTPDFMAPEQFTTPDSVSQLSDVYSLGAVMYLLFVGKKHVEDITNWQQPLSTITTPLAELIAHCLEVKPADRPPTEEVKLRLLRLLKGAHIGETQKREANSVVKASIDNFMLLDVIERNQYGAVYLFEDKLRKQLFVIKKRIKSNAGLREAKQLIEIKHPNLIEVLGTSKNEHAFIVVMQHLTGGSLQERLSRPFGNKAFIATALQLCHGMQAAHNKLIVHGNLRPSNILFDDQERVRISDFGFEAHYHGAQADSYQPNVLAEASTARDVYSMGAIFHHMLTGKPLKYSNRRIQSCPAFEILDADLKRLLRDMLDTESATNLDRFDKVISRLKSLNTKKPNANNKLEQVPAEHRPGINWRLAGGLAILALAAITLLA